MLLFVWILLNDRLLTTDNLSRRGICNIAPPLCVDKCITDETSSHLFFYCHVACKLWVDVLSWLDISCALSNKSSSHDTQFIGLVFQ